jgi:ABC-2 type transport system ATP-binding protein
MIEVDLLTKDYAGRPALKEITFSVEKGEILGFLGPNGAGKTTTMRILTGYLPPTSGSASIAGFDVTSQSLEARRHIGYLPESVPLYRELTVYDYLEFVARLRGIRGDVRAKKIAVAMEKANLGAVSDRIIGKLSKGFRQRVGIAQAVIHEPDVMILDEPTEGLDPRQRSDTRALIRELGKEHTVILSTHILPEVEATCDRVLIINEGAIVASDTPEGLSGKMKRGQRLEALVGAEDDHVRLALQSLPGVLSVRTEAMPENRRRVLIEGDPEVELRHRVARALVKADIDLFELRAEAVSLEDIFLRLTRTDTQVAADDRSEREGEDGAGKAEAAGEAAPAASDPKPRAGKATQPRSGEDKSSGDDKA